MQKFELNKQGKILGIGFGPIQGPIEDQIKGWDS
jgi:hypothetical protein